jgi:hypothetical protein
VQRKVQLHCCSNVSDDSLNNYQKYLHNFFSSNPVLMTTHANASAGRRSNAKNQCFSMDQLVTVNAQPENAMEIKS